MQAVNRHIVSKFSQRILFISVSAISALFVSSVSASSLWVPSAQAKANTTETNAKVAVSKGNFQSLDGASLQQQFSDKNIELTMAIPLPDGTLADFRLTPSSIMSSELAARYPEFMSYDAVQVNNPQSIGRFSLTHKGLSGIFRHQGQWALLSPLYEGNDEQYVSYYYHDSDGESLIPQGMDDSIDTLSLHEEDGTDSLATAQKTTGDTLTTYRLALSATGEYTQAVGGSKADAVAEMITLVNRVNQILLVGTAIQFELIDNEDIIYTDAATDPYTNSDANEDIDTNQQVVDDAIGSENYDIGHLLATNPGGLAFVGVVCLNTHKARGYTGNTSPQGERFYIDLVIHELGHQLDATHSFNAQDFDDCNEEQRSSSSAFEPGSGSTIMSYAGICGSQNLQFNSDPYFHAGSVEQIRDFVDTGRGRLCGTTTNLSNAAPDVSVSATSYNIPANTPFLLDAQASDDETLTYTWEQIDAGGVTGGTVDASEMRSDNGANPLFRSYAAVAESYRYFPALEDVLNDTVSFGEAYPTTDRELTFRITAKDSRGGVDTADVTLDVTNTGSAFAVTQPTGTAVWQGNTAQTISWNTASTQNAPINCQSVDIKADLDGDNTFDSVLISETPNDGEQAIFSPNTITTDARVMVSCADNVFYAVNPASFRITQGSSNVAPVIDSQAVLSVNEEGSIAITLDDLQVTDPDSTYPDNFTLALQAGNNYTLENTSTVVPDANFNGELSVTVTVNDGIDDSNAFPLVVTVNPVNDAPLATNDTQTVAQDSTATLINVLSNDTDIDGDTLSISDISYSGSGTVSISGEQISYQPAAGFSGNDSLSYTVSDGSTTDTGTLTITVTATPTNNTPTSGNSSGGGGSLGYLWLGLLSLTALTRRRSLPLS